MQFYDRDCELNILKKNQEQALRQAVFTTMMGRRRVGKTALLMRSVEGVPALYLYVSKDNEQMLCRRMQQAAEETLGVHIYGQTRQFSELLEQLMIYGEEHPFTLIVDEFQNLLSVNPAIPSHVQDVWDRYHQRSKVNFIVCGSIYSMMHKIFDHADAPLYGRRDSNMLIRPFSIAVLKGILYDYNAAYQPDDLLCLYMLTGGVAKYVALLMDAQAVTKRRMLEYVTTPDSPFLVEGTEMLLSEFGRDYSTYFSILQLIAGGMTSQAQIDSIIGKNTGAYLSNLSEEYSFVKKALPLLSKSGSRNSRWYIDDCFLRFWFSFIYPYQGLIESGRMDLMRKHIFDRYDQFSGLTLEHYFRQKFRETGSYTRVGNWWDRKGVNELDLVAVNEFDHTGVVAEIKRNSNKINLAVVADKVKSLPPAEYGDYRFEVVALSLQDM